MLGNRVYILCKKDDKTDIELDHKIFKLSLT